MSGSHSHSGGSGGAHSHGGGGDGGPGELIAGLVGGVILVVLVVAMKGVIGLGQFAYDTTTHHPHIAKVSGDWGSLFIDIGLSLIFLGIGVLLLIMAAISRKRTTAGLAVAVLALAGFLGLILAPKFSAKVARLPPSAPIAVSIQPGRPIPTPSRGAQYTMPSGIVVRCAWVSGESRESRILPCNRMKADLRSQTLQGLPEFVFDGLSVGTWHYLHADDGPKWTIGLQIQHGAKKEQGVVWSTNEEGPFDETNDGGTDLIVDVRLDTEADAPDAVYFTLSTADDPHARQRFTVRLR